MCMGSLLERAQDPLCLGFGAMISPPNEQGGQLSNSSYVLSGPSGGDAVAAILRERAML